MESKRIVWEGGKMIKVIEIDPNIPKFSLPDLKGFSSKEQEEIIEELLEEEYEPKYPLDQKGYVYDFFNERKRYFLEPGYGTTYNKFAAHAYTYEKFLNIKCKSDFFEPLNTSLENIIPVEINLSKLEKRKPNINLSDFDFSDNSCNCSDKIYQCNKEKIEALTELQKANNRIKELESLLKSEAKRIILQDGSGNKLEVLRNELENE